jgi:glycosyltransferase involved in cell wall biosynthesis
VRIVFDVSPLSHQRTGVNNYILGSLRGLVDAAAGRHEIVALAPTSFPGARTIRETLAGLDVEVAAVRLPLAHALRTAWSRLGRPAAERFVGRFDALHFTDWMYPPQRGGVRATTIHDLVPLRFPEWVTGRTRTMHSRKYVNAARTCDVLFCNSAFTAGEVVELMGVPAERTRVAHPAPAEIFRPEGPPAELERPYLLTVATLEPRKNLDTLVDAWRLLGDRYLLAVAGGSGWGPQPKLDVDGVVRLGYVSDAELAALYRGAAAAVYPSRFEGFGIPILEAMACGTPVVASAHPSMDEASGDTAVRADPESPEAMAAAIEEAVRRRDELAAQGLAHARRFSWGRVGETFLEGYGA